MRHKKIYHFILTAVLISAIILPLSGCTLAKKDAGEDAKDTLIGVFVTEEYLDLFGTDAYLYGQYANPLYATVNRHGSDELSDWEVSFQNIRGLNFLAPIRTKTESHTVQPRKATASATLIPISVHLMIKRNSDYQLLSTASQRHRARILLILQILSTRLPTEKSIPFLPAESASAPLTAKEHVCQRLSATRQRQKISGA